MACQEFPISAPPTTFKAGPFNTLDECEEGCGSCQNDTDCGGEEHCCDGVCQTEHCACSTCEGCTWPGEFRYGPGGTLSGGIETPLTSNLTDILNSAFNTGKVAWKPGYPAALAGCNTQWRYEGFEGAYEACAAAGSGYCRRGYYSFRLLQCESDGSTTDITGLAVEELVAGGIFKYVCGDTDDNDEAECEDCGCSDEPQNRQVTLNCTQ